MKKSKDEIVGVLKNIVSDKKFQIGLTIILFLIILITSVNLRVSNLNSLIDKTTGQYGLADPDAYYEYRVAQTIVRTGDISGIDPYRNPGLNISYTQEMLPKILALSYKIINFFGYASLDYIDVLYPILAFAISLTIFFVLALYLSKSKTTAVIASAFLAYSPVYLGRTGAGVSSHEALGMIFLFLSLLIFIFSLNNYQKNWKKVLLYGFLTGFSLSLSLFSWGGGANFVLMILPLTSFCYYLFNLNKRDIKEKEKFIIFNLIWIISSVLVMPFFGYNFSAMYSRFLSNYGVIIPFVLMLLIFDYIFQKKSDKIKSFNNKYRILYSLIISLFLGIIGLIILGKNPLVLLKDIYTQLLFPFGLGRVGLTVAYYAQPYITDLINQYGSSFFWMGFFGMILIGIEISRGIESTKHKIYFVSSWVIAISGMLFSRISSSNIFNGINFISQLVYILSFGVFAFYFLWLCLNDNIKSNNENWFLFAWMMVMLISTRSAVRVLFVIFSFFAFSVAFLIVKLYRYAKQSKDETLKYILYAIFFISLILSFVYLFGNPLNHNNNPGAYTIISYQASNSGPLANDQWQNAMAWVRNNTGSNDIFVHWWDYGYLVQTIAGRPTIVDGGNANAYWDYLVGRYLLTTPKPETALSLMKSHNISYLLIDPTDLGKYAAYSKIGSDNNWDRFSSPTTVASDPKQSIETANGTEKVYLGQTFVDGDIIYNNVLLPGPSFDSDGIATYNSYFIGFTLKTINSNGSLAFEQPKAVFFYNNQQYRIPVRFIYFQNRIIDFGTGINTTFVIMPKIEQTSSGQLSVDPIGAGIYLSERTESSLFAKLYLMEDPYNEYPTIKVVDREDDYVVKTLKSQGMDLGSFVYFNGLRAPLEIWRVSYPSNILVHSEFKQPSGEYGGLDNLTFVK